MIKAFGEEYCIRNALNIWFYYIFILLKNWKLTWETYKSVIKKRLTSNINFII